MGKVQRSPSLQVTPTTLNRTPALPSAGWCEILTFCSTQYLISFRLNVTRFYLITQISG